MVLNVRIEQLPALRLASLRVKSESPEGEALQKLLQWASVHHQLTAGYRLFGYDNCEPVPNHIYTALITVNETVEADDIVEIVSLAGGRYAVVSVNTTDQISEAWDMLAEWMKTSGYEYGSLLALEEHVAMSDDPFNFQRYEMYLPLAG